MGFATAPGAGPQVKRFLPLLDFVEGRTDTYAATNLAANRAEFFAFTLHQEKTIAQIRVLNGATISGNVDVGIYNSTGTRQVSSGSTAHAGANAYQVFDITDTVLPAGNYFFAIAADNGTATFMRNTTATSHTRVSVTQATAFALPATATFAFGGLTIHPPVVTLEFTA